MIAATLELILPPWPNDTDRPLPVLAALLRRAERRDGWPTGAAARLLARCGCAYDGEPPLAPLCCLADGGDPADAYWLRADPVHLAADQDKLYLSATAETLAITQEEATLLAQEFNTLFQPDGWQLIPLTATRWYLRCDHVPAITATAPQAALARDIRPLLPKGADAMAWHAMLNEVQMLFHASDVSARRAARNLPAINSLWPWGGGRLPQRCDVPWQRVYADDCVARGLAVLGGRPWSPLPADLGTVLDGDTPALVVFDAHGGDWALLERDWLVPLRAALRSGRLDSLVLHLPGTGASYRLDRTLLRRWWRDLFGKGRP